MFGQLLRTSVPKLRSTVSALLSLGSAQTKNLSFFGKKPLSLQLNPVRGYKVHSSLKKRCEHCFFVHRRKRLFVICKVNPKHKQRQG